MPSNCLMPGMVNFPVNMSEEERRVLGRAAFDGDQSLGAFIRHYLVKGLERERPELAERVIEIRRRRKGLALVAVIALATWLQWAGELDDAMRRPGAARAARREEAV